MVCDVVFVCIWLNWNLFVKLLCKCCLVWFDLMIINFYGWELIDDGDKCNVFKIIVKFVWLMCFEVL